MMGSLTRQQVAADFLGFSVENGLLCFGDFTTKSGRRSPYFLNTGLADNGRSLSQLARHYLAAAELHGLRFDGLFGSAYKGIALAAAIAVESERTVGTNPVFAFNRKEAKDHGDNGRIVGRLNGNILLVDDVVTSGISVKAAFEDVVQAGASVCGVLVALDRGERMTESSSVTAVQELQRQLDIPVHSIATVHDLRAFLAETGKGDALERIDRHIGRYGV